MIKESFKAFKLVFRDYKYIILAFFITLLFFVIATIIPSYNLVKLLAQGNLFKIPGIVFDFFIYNSTLISRFLLLILAILSGLNFALLVFYLKRRIKKERSLGTGLAGSIFGILGFGCAACGSVILTSIFGFSATIGFLSILPFRGLEFAFLGIILLLFSIHIFLDKISNPSLCKNGK